MKPRKEIYQEICKALESMVDQGSLRYVDMNKGQLEQREKSFPIPFPAVLIHIGSVTYAPLPGNRLEGDAVITLTVAFDNRHFSFVGSKDKSESEDLMDLLNTIGEKLTYVRGETFTDLACVAEEHLPYRFNGLQIHTMTFTCKTYHLIKTNEYISITKGA